MVEGEPPGDLLSPHLHRQLSRQVPVMLPVQLRLTPERGTVIWLDGFRRWRGALSFDTWLLTDRRDPLLAFEEPRPDRTTAFTFDRVDVIVTADGVERRASRGEIATSSCGWGPDGSSEASWRVPVADDVGEVTIRLACRSLPLHRIFELDADLLRTALDDVWEMG